MFQDLKKALLPLGTIGLYGHPTGFSVVTQRIQIDLRGCPVHGVEFSLERPNPNGLRDILFDLCFAPEGEFEVLVFVVTTAPRVTIDESAQWSPAEAASKFNSTDKELPDSIARQPWAAAQAYPITTCTFLPTTSRGH